VPPAKRLGMIEDIAAQQPFASELKSVRHVEVERLVGRCINLATVMVEANPHLAAMYRIKEAKVVVKANGKRMRITPKMVFVAGGSIHTTNYQEAIAWWRHALEDDVSVPLAPRLHFPELGEKGVAFLFSDAAREDGTGYGGFSLVERGRRTELLFLAEKWEVDAILALQHNKLSMPAGEGIGVVVLADAVVRELCNVSHLVVFSDSAPVVAALNSDNSGSPQLNFIVKWLLDKHPQLKILGIHQPGVRNSAADDLSRARAPRVLEEAHACGAHCLALAPTHELDKLVQMATRMPQRATCRPSQAK
jgi:hypothetical protein